MQRRGASVLLLDDLAEDTSLARDAASFNKKYYISSLNSLTTSVPS